MAVGIRWSLKLVSLTVAIAICGLFSTRVSWLKCGITGNVGNNEWRWSVRYKVIFLDRDNIDICLKAKELLKI